MHNYYIRTIQNIQPPERGGGLGKLKILTQLPLVSLALGLTCTNNV